MSNEWGKFKNSPLQHHKNNYCRQDAKRNGLKFEEKEYLNCHQVSPPRYLSSMKGWGNTVRIWVRNPSDGTLTRRSRLTSVIRHHMCLMHWERRITQMAFVPNIHNLSLIARGRDKHRLRAPCKITARSSFWLSWSQIGRDGHMTAKCQVGSWTGSCNRRRTLMKKPSEIRIKSVVD